MFQIPDRHQLIATEGMRKSVELRVRSGSRVDESVLKVWLAFYVQGLCIHRWNQLQIKTVLKKITGWGTVCRSVVEHVLSMNKVVDSIPRVVPPFMPKKIKKKLTISVGWM